MAQPITIDALKLEGFRAYLKPQTVPLRRGTTPLSLAVFAPNAKGKSSLVDGLEFYFSEEATLARLGKRSVHTHAGRVAMEHVDAAESGVSPAVHLWFREGKESFDDARPVSASATPLTAAAGRVLADTRLPFIIRGHELRGFVEEKTPEDRYREMAAWFALDALVAIQQKLRQLRRQVKAKAESDAEAGERLRDLKRVTNNAVSVWDEATVCAWLNAEVLAHLDKSLALPELLDKDPGYEDLAKRKAAEEETLGLVALKRLVDDIEALFRPAEDDGEGPTGRIFDFEAAVPVHVGAVERESAERSKGEPSHL